MFFSPFNNALQLRSIHSGALRQLCHASKLISISPSTPMYIHRFTTPNFRIPVYVQSAIAYPCFILGNAVSLPAYTYSSSEQRRTESKSSSNTSSGDGDRSSRVEVKTPHGIKVSDPTYRKDGYFFEIMDRIVAGIIVFLVLWGLWWCLKFIGRAIYNWYWLT